MQIVGIQNSTLVTRNVPAAINARSSRNSASSSLPGVREILLNSFVSTSEKIPRLELTSPVAGFRVNLAVGFLVGRFQVSPLPVADNVQKKSSFTDLKIQTLADIKVSLNDLRNRVSALRRLGALNIRSAISSRPNLVEADASNASPEGEFAVQPGRLAAGSILVSDVQSTTNDALGFSGSFVVNGSRVTVESSDSLIDIKNKINFGEDLNQNGILDPAEDINGNGIAETLQRNPSEFGPGVFIVEDINGNGILDPAEDVNDNDRIDGGTGETNVVASILAGRLVLASRTGLVNTVDLQDDDDVLLSLGFFELNSKGFSIPKEQQLDFSTRPPADLNKASQKAVIAVDGEIFTNNTNTFDNVIEGTRLNIKKASDLISQVQIITNPGNAVEQIKSLFDSFNNSIKQINNAINLSRVFERDPEIQRIRRSLVDNPQQRIRKINADNRDIDAIRANRENTRIIGLESVNTGKSIVQEVAVTRTVQAIKEGITIPLKNIGNDLLKRLTSIGILTEEDNTVKVDEAELKRALTINTEGVLDVLLNPVTGLLPLLDRELSRILKEDLGDIDLKRDEVVVKSGIPSVLAGKFQRAVEAVTLRNKVQKLIAVA